MFLHSPLNYWCIVNDLKNIFWIVNITWLQFRRSNAKGIQEVEHLLSLRSLNYFLYPALFNSFTLVSSVSCLFLRICVINYVHPVSSRLCFYYNALFCNVCKQLKTSINFNFERYLTYGARKNVKFQKIEVCIEGDHKRFIASTGNISINCRFVYSWITLRAMNIFKVWLIEYLKHFFKCWMPIEGHKM
jgi:hypothetical protein